MIGSTSGEASIMPPQDSTKGTSAISGSQRSRASRIWLSTCASGFGSSTRSRSNGDAASSGQRDGVASAGRNRGPTEAGANRTPPERREEI